MGHHEKQGGSVEYYTPAYIFDGMGVRFDLDVAHPACATHVPADEIITHDGLVREWRGFIWMNPPFLNYKNKLLWIEKFIQHGNGVALLPDQTSAKWWHKLTHASDAVLFIDGRVRFITPEGIASQPANGTTLFAIGEKGKGALVNAEANKLGILRLKP